MLLPQLIPCELTCSDRQLSGGSSEEMPWECPGSALGMPCMLFQPACRSCSYRGSCSSVQLKEFLSPQECLDRGWLRLLQGQSDTKIPTCSPLHPAEHKPRPPPATLELVAGEALFRAPQGCWREPGSRQGTSQAGSTILSLGSSQDTVVRASNQGCDLMPWPRCLSQPASSPQQSMWQAVPGTQQAFTHLAQGSALP